MIKAYRITEEEKNSLEGTKMANDVHYKPYQDINGDWFIFEIEHLACSLGVEAEFVPPEDDENLIF